MSYLIVDDDEIDIMITERMIQNVNPNVKPVIAKNGKEAISFLEEYQMEKVHARPLKFILIDLMMPMMNGFEFLEAYKAFS